MVVVKQLAIRLVNVDLRLAVYGVILPIEIANFRNYWSHSLNVKQLYILNYECKAVVYFELCIKLTKDTCSLYIVKDLRSSVFRCDVLHFDSYQLQSGAVQRGMGPGEGGGPQ